MKINITTNHIRIYKLLNFIPDKNIDFICHFLNMNKQNVILYIKQIYQFTENKNKNKNTLLVDIIREIVSCKSLFKILKQNQVFTKEDRIFYIILTLLKSYNSNLNLNLNLLSFTLNISRRTLNSDLICVKQSLNFYHLEIFSLPGKGISILGDLNNIKNCFLSYIFKFLVEFEELPLLMSKDFLSFFQQKISKNLIQEIDYFIYAFDLDIFANNKKLLKSVYRIYLDEDSQENISMLTYEEFKKYFSEVFSSKNIEKAYSFLTTSTLGNFPLKYINIFILTLKFCAGTLKEKNISLDSTCDKLKTLFSKFTSLDYFQNNYFEKFTHRVHIANKECSFLSMYDLSFLNFNLNSKIKRECYCLFLELRKSYFNIQFSNIIFLYLWNLNRSDSSKNTNIIVIFKDLPKFLHSIIKNLLLLKENVHISSFIKYSELDSYLLQEEVSLIITFEKLTLTANYPPIKYYSLPL